MAEVVEQKHLAGLTFRTSEKKKVRGDDGSISEKYVVVERKLTVADIIAQTDNGGSFTIVTGDGKKYQLPKTPAKGTGGEAAAGKPAGDKKEG